MKSTHQASGSGIIEQGDELQEAHVRVFMALHHLSPDGQAIPRNRRQWRKSQRSAQVQKAVDHAVKILPIELLEKRAKTIAFIC